ncbi:MAG TPA: LOG family protein [Alphaproteobacteria bacterium]|nr:LOG family protein [Alphaproteobacteria bacterium]
MSDDRHDEVQRPPKAYENLDFLHSRAARPLRILSEYLQPEDRFASTHVRDTIVVFGSARAPSPSDVERLERAGEQPARLKLARYYQDARELSRRLTEWSKSLGRDDRRFVVCTGAGPGVMMAANRGASEARGLNVGLGISLPFEAVNNPYVTRQLSFEFHYFFTRKFWFVYLAKAIVIMPGGFGTLDEFFEVLTLLQTGKLKKKIAVVLYGKDFWDRVLNLEAMVDYGVIDRADLDLFHRSDDVEDAFAFITEELTRRHLGDPGPTM